MMKISHEIRFFLLSIAYIIVLTAVIIPHHHHDEIACYQSTHCDAEAGEHDHHGEAPDDHHHHNEGEDSEHCISLEHYVISYAGNNITRELDLFLQGHDHQPFSNAWVGHTGKVSGKIRTCRLTRFIVLKNTFTEFVRLDTPLRAPPSYIA